jgi:DNA polymerase III alpha subunit
MIEVGGLRTTGFDRQLLLHEYNTWVTLSPKEQKNIIELTPRNNCTSIKESLAILLDMEKGIQKTRKDKVSSLYKLLVNPPTSLADSSSYIAKVEEENLGISVSCSRVDSAYKMDANCTCHQYKQGRGERDIVIACEITDFKEFKVKNGDNRGKPMCKMTVSDKSGSLEVVCFSKAYEQCGGLLYLGNTVELVGRRNDDDGYVVEGAQQV